MEKKSILETGILVPISNTLNEVEYALTCFDGYAIGQLTDDEPTAPETIKMTYPTLDEILADEEKANYVLEYRGLYDLTKEDIHFGDIMMAFGEVVK